MFYSAIFRFSKNITPRTHTVDGDEIADIFPSDERVPNTQNAAGDTSTSAVYRGGGGKMGVCWLLKPSRETHTKSPEVVTAAAQKFIRNGRAPRDGRPHYTRIYIYTYIV